MLILLLTVIESKATHIYGADLLYTHISGNQYKVSLYIYGDCSGGNFKYLPGSPVVNVYNSNTLFRTLTLKVESPINGLDVTPVCPAEIGKTKCTSLSYTTPGVKRFTYSDTITLNTTSTNWRFRFTGAMGSTSAGRSTTITNVVGASSGNIIMNLEATLNNTSVNNASPAYTTIPTPFFCINKFVNYNTGATDADGDSLVYTLVPGLTANGIVSYNTGYTATTPLAVATGSFSFNSSTGQLAFLPNMLQKSLVVIRVDEYRNGVLIGTSMREMTFIITNCNNNPPGGVMSNNNRGTLDSTGTKLSVCKPIDTLRFNINPTDLDTAHKITVSYKGLPVGATVAISNNGTINTSSIVTWNTKNVTPGSYIFFVTYLDDGCPIVSKQTLAYTIDILPEPRTTVSILSEATCVKKALVNINPVSSPSAWTIQIRQGTSLLNTYYNITTAKTDSLAPGSYSIRVINADSCFWDTAIIINTPPPVSLLAAVNDIKCNGDNSGMVTITGSAGRTPYRYAINNGNYSSNNTFTGLTSGTYTLRIRDTNDCINDTTVSLTDPSKLAPNISLKNSTCETLGDGMVRVIAAGGTPPYTYAIGSSAFSNTSTYTPLATGNYTFHIKDSNNCLVDTTVVITDSLLITANYVVTDALCADSSSGTISITASGGSIPYKYAINNGSYNTTNQFKKLISGNYTISIVDSYGCKKDTTLEVGEPNKIHVVVSITNIVCNADTTGTISLSGLGGTSPFQYAFDNSSFSSKNNYTGLKAKSYHVKIRDTNNCYADTAVTLTEPTALRFSLSLKDVLCYGDNSGTVTVTSTGGTPSYTYAYDASGYQTQTNLTGLNAGRHTIRMRDSKGCYKDSTIVISQPTPITIRETDITNATCEGFADGTITFLGNGGVKPYLYSINNGVYDNSNTKKGLTEGRHTISIKDNNNCIKDSIVELYGYPHILFSKTKTTPVTCFGDADGQLEIIAGGGSPRFKYKFGNESFSSNNVFDNLNAGSYTITVEDSLGCKKDTTLVIESPRKIAIETHVTPNNCDGLENNGMIAAKVTGGTEPYSYSWSIDSSLNKDRITGMPNGKYMVVVSDYNDCSESAESEIKYDNCCTIFIPDAFTPNNDGRNDYARILYKGEFTLQRFSIYNRFGELVFTTNDINAGWDGIHNGRKQDLGTYFYYATGLCGNDRKNPVLYKGDITLIK